jgi:hypothetical protein
LHNKPTAAVHTGAFMLTSPREEEEEEEEEEKKKKAYILTSGYVTMLFQLQTLRGFE